MALLVIINLVIRGWSNDSIALSRDEPFTVYFSQFRFSELLPLILDEANANTYAFEVILHYWSAFFGSSIKTLRWLPTIIMSFGAIPIYHLGKRIGGQIGAIMSSLLFLGSSFIMNVSHLDRPYCILITGSIFMVYLFIRLFETDALRYQLLWIASAVLTCYTHHFGWLTIALLWFALLGIKEFREKMLRKLTLSTTLVILLCLPILVHFLHLISITQAELESSHSSLNTQRFSLLIGEFLNGDSVTVTLATICLFVGSYLLYSRKTATGIMLIGFSSFVLITLFYAYYKPLHSVGGVLLAALFLLSISASILISRSKASPAKKLVIHWAILPLTIGFFLSGSIPLFVDRYMSFTIPAILLLVVLLLNEIPHRTIQIGAFGVLFTVYLASFCAAPKYYIDHRPAVEKFRDYHAQAEVSIVGPGYFDFDFVYYFDNELFYNGALHMTDTLGKRISYDNSYVRFKEGMRRELRQHRIVVSNDSSTLQLDTLKLSRVAFFDGNLPLSYPNNGIFEYLERRFGPPQKMEDFSGLYRIYMFCAQPCPLGNSQ
jgi:hypothetical protein